MPDRFGVAIVGTAQQAPAPRANASAFEVVSIKPCNSDTERSTLNSSNGRLKIVCGTVDGLIRGAYLFYADGKRWPVNSARTGVPTPPVPQSVIYEPIEGSPKWITSERYNIDAKADGPATIEMMQGPLMRQLLEDRFRLKVHRTTKEVPAYALVVAKGGAKLVPSPKDSCVTYDPSKGPLPQRTPEQPVPPAVCGAFSRPQKGGGLNVKGVTLADLCFRLSYSMDGDVIDRTGISGVFDIHLNLSFSDVSYGAGRKPHPPAAVSGEASDPGNSVRAALHESGLDLQRIKQRIPVVAIDRIDKPTPN